MTSYQIITGEVRMSFARTHGLPLAWIDDSPIPRSMRKRLEALELDFLETLPRMLTRLKNSIESGDDEAVVQARADLATLTGVNISSSEGLVERTQSLVCEGAKLEAMPRAPCTRQTLAAYLSWISGQKFIQAEFESAKRLVQERCTHLMEHHIGSIEATQNWVKGLDWRRFADMIEGAVSTGLSTGDLDRWRWLFDARTNEHLMVRLNNGKSVSGALWEGFDGLERWASSLPKVVALAKEAVASRIEDKLMDLVEEWSTRTFQGVKHQRHGLNYALSQLMSGACEEEYHGTRKSMRSSCVAYVRWLVPTALDEAGFDDSLLERLKVAFPKQRSVLTKLSPSRFMAKVEKRLNSQLAKHEQRYALSPIKV